MVNGFILIELMVVIAIVALLSVLALPNYSTYTERVKYSSMTTILREMIDKSIQYHSIHGTWPLPAAIGYPAEANEGSLSEEFIAAIDPDLGEVNLNHPSLILSPCEEIGGVEFAFRADVTDFDDVASFWYVAEINGIYYITCQDESTSGHDVVGMSCINEQYPTKDDMAAAVCP